MYGKIFDSMYEGTLYGHWEAIITLQQMIVLCNPDGIIDMTPQAISARTSIPLEIITKGIKILSEPDEYSRTPGEEGKRIVLIDTHRPWGWQLVNHAKYKAMTDIEKVRAQTRERVKRHREQQESVTLRNASNAEKRYTDTDTDTSKPKTLGGSGPAVSEDVEFEKAWKAYPKRAGDNPKKAAKQKWNARIKEGATSADLQAGVDRYAAFVRASDRESTEYVMQAVRFFGPDKPYQNAWTPPPKPQAKAADLNTIEGIMAYGKRKGVEPKVGESREAYRARLLQERSTA